MKRTTEVLERCGSLGAALLCFAVLSVEAQSTPKVFFACYVSATGTVYRIKEPGLATQCTNKNHIEFSWIDGVPGYDHGALNGLADDDHPQYVLADGTRSTTNGFAITGTLGVGAVPATGPGARFMWYPGKLAFRAGNAGGAEWDDARIGLNSYALGSQVEASGRSSTAMGISTIASGTVSLAWGEGSIASGNFSVAMGRRASTNAHQGSFVYGDVSDPTRSVLANLDNSVVVRAQHVWFGTSGDQPTSAAGYLTADGVIASTAGGFKFPDGSVQTTAAAGGANGTPDNTPNTLVQRDGSGGFAAGSVQLGQLSVSGGGISGSGTFGTGSIPASGPGVRLMWYPAKASFRAGSASGMSEWDDINVGEYSTATGYGTTAGGSGSTAMGYSATASGPGSTAMGVNTTARGINATAMGATTTASGVNSTAMGYLTTASGFASTAMGAHAASDKGSFVYGDASTDNLGGTVVNTTAFNSFVVRAQHVWFGKSGDQVATSGHYVETSTGAYLSDGGDWTNASDVNRKENFQDEQAAAVLERLARLSIRTWNYKADDARVRHLGPTAQDFQAAFHLGSSDKAISTVDAAGVALLSIQALERRTRDQESEIAALRAELASLRAQMTQRLPVAESPVKER